VLLELMQTGPKKKKKKKKYCIIFVVNNSVVCDCHLTAITPAKRASFTFIYKVVKK
jgi:hypothetical protein